MSAHGFSEDRLGRIRERMSGFVERGEILLLPRRAKLRRRCAGRRRGAAPATTAEQARAVDADVGELIEMGHADVERLASTK